MLENITTLSEAAALATSAALTDELVSHGELMSTLLFVEILRDRKVQAEWFDVRKVMRTDDHFGRAVPDSAALTELAQTLLKPRLQQALVITQGFIGCEPKGRTTTLGRGGSDFTAALLGEALNVSRVDIWTDVPGIYTTDPRVVPAAKRIDKIAFEEAAEMATFGAKVLHPATLLPAVRSNIPVFVGSSKDPAAGGTLVCNTTENPPLFRALALRRKQTLLTLHSLNMLHARGFLAEVFNILARHNISVDSDHHFRSQRGIDHGYHRFHHHRRQPANHLSAHRTVLAVPGGSGRKSGTGRPDRQQAVTGLRRR